MRKYFGLSGLKAKDKGTQQKPFFLTVDFEILNWEYSRARKRGEEKERPLVPGKQK